MLLDQKNLGSFDPITYGHMDIIERGCGLFDKVVVAIAKSESKNPMFSLEDRIKLAESIYEGNDKVEVVGFPREANNLNFIITFIYRFSKFNSIFQ